jgi:hypothetical protein
MLNKPINPVFRFWRTLGVCGLLLFCLYGSGMEGRAENLATLRFDENGMSVHLEFQEPVSLVKLGKAPPLRILIKHKDAQLRIMHKHLTMWMGNSFASIPRTAESRTFDFYLSREDLALYIGKNAPEQLKVSINSDLIAKGDFQVAREILGNVGSGQLEFYVPAATEKRFKIEIYSFKIQAN